MHPLLYEINTRVWLRELSGRAGRAVRLNEVPEAELDLWAGLGLTHIWLMGVWSGGPKARAQALAAVPLHAAYAEALPGWRDEDVGGSPYAIADYQVPAALGGEDGLAAFRAQLSARGIKLLLDFVPNHLGVDHPWLRTRPELFVEGKPNTPGSFLQQTDAGPRWIAHGKDPYFPAWTDTAQLDYRRAETRRAMGEALLGVASRCDGVRCDMAMLVLNDVFERTWGKAGEQEGGGAGEFWTEAVAQVKARHPDFLFLAEVYWGLESRLRALRFDYTYDKGLYDKLMARDGRGARQHLLGSPPEAAAHSAHFLENHDERRVASVLSTQEQWATALLILTLPGMRFLHQGQLEGARVRVPVQLVRRLAEPVSSEIHALYERLLVALRSSAVGRGRGALVRDTRAAWTGNPSFETMVLTLWQEAPLEFDLAVVNLAPHASQCRAWLPVTGVAGHQWRMRERFSAAEYIRSGAGLEREGLYLDVPAWAGQLFHFTRA